MGTSFGKLSITSQHFNSVKSLICLELVERINADIWYTLTPEKIFVICELWYHQLLQICENILHSLENRHLFLISVGKKFAASETSFLPCKTKPPPWCDVALNPFDHLSL